MRPAAAVSTNSTTIPKGWTILGLALASWGLVFILGQVAVSLFAFISANL